MSGDGDRASRYAAEGAHSTKHEIAKRSVRNSKKVAGMVLRHLGLLSVLAYEGVVRQP